GYNPDMNPQQKPTKREGSPERGPDGRLRPGAKLNPLGLGGYGDKTKVGVYEEPEGDAVIPPLLRAMRLISSQPPEKDLTALEKSCRRLFATDFKTFVSQMTSLERAALAKAKEKEPEGATPTECPACGHNLSSPSERPMRSEQLEALMDRLQAE